MTCGNCRSAIATRRYAYGQGAIRNIAPLCDGCVASLEAIGMDLRPHQPTLRQAVVREPEKDTRPMWLRNLTPKDMTPRGAA
jgi:hypothetical protein